MVSTMTNVEPMQIPKGYKQTEVGVIPEDWRIHEFGELVNYIKGYPFKSSEYTNDGIRVIRVSDTTRDSIADKNAVFVTSNSSTKYRKWKLKESDLIFTTVGSKPPMYDSLVGKAIFVTAAYDGSLLNQNAVLIRSKNGASYFQRLLLGHFRTERYIDHIELIFRGNANQASITLGNLFEFKLPIPSDIKEQTAIANALSDVDNLIASLETLIAKKSAIKTAAMQQLLTGKKRLPAFVKESEKQGAKQSGELDNTSETAQAAQAKQASTLNSDLYKESGEGVDSRSNQQSEVSNANNKQTTPRPGYKQTELGEIPEDWEVRVLGESLSIMHGRDQKQVECADGKFPILGTGGEMGRTDSYLYNKPSVLIGRKGSINKPRYMDSPFWTVDTLFYSQVSEKFNAKFIFYKFCMIDWMSYNEASGVPSLNSSTIESVVQVFPETREEQTAIANVLSDMDTELDTLQQRLSKTQKIKQGMMQELLTGKTRLPFVSDAKAST
jgi:type I restriction enzyme S subunit